MRGIPCQSGAVALDFCFYTKKRIILVVEAVGAKELGKTRIPP
jgi:hypothetical protein